MEGSVMSERRRRTVASQVLTAIPLFSHIDEEEHQELHALMIERRFQSGQALMRAWSQEGHSKSFSRAKWNSGSWTAMTRKL